MSFTSDVKKELTRNLATTGAQSASPREDLIFSPTKGLIFVSITRYSSVPMEIEIEVNVQES